MKIECTPRELKELLCNQKETPVAGTTDESLKLDSKKLIHLFCQSLANCDTAQEA